MLIKSLAQTDLVDLWWSNKEFWSCHYPYFEFFCHLVLFASHNNIHFRFIANFKNEFLKVPSRVVIFNDLAPGVVPPHQSQHHEIGNMHWGRKLLRQ